VRVRVCVRVCVCVCVCALGVTAKLASPRCNSMGIVLCREHLDGSKAKDDLLGLLHRVENKINNDDLMIRDNVCSCTRIQLYTY